MGEPHRITPRPDPTAADTATLVGLGQAGPPPLPSRVPPARPHRGGPRPDPGRGQRADQLADALADAGVTADAADQDAVAVLAGLDPATVATVTEWIRRSTPQDPPTRT